MHFWLLSYVEGSCCLVDPLSSPTCFGWSRSAPDVFSWEPQQEALGSAGHCWVLVQCRKQVLKFTTADKTERKKRPQTEAQACGKLETSVQKLH